MSPSGERDTDEEGRRPKQPDERALKIFPPIMRRIIAEEAREIEEEDDNARQRQDPSHGQGLAPTLARLGGLVHALPNGEVEGPAGASGRTQVERSSSGAP